jgi:hypothetical protein
VVFADSSVFFHADLSSRHAYIQLGYGLKIKAIPVKAWPGPEGSRKFRLPDFKTIGTIR